MGIFGSIFGAIGAHQAGNTIYKAGTTAQKNTENQIAAGQGDVNTALTNATAGVNAAADKSIGAVNAATGTANTGLSNTLASEQGNLNPYLDAGKSGVTGLQAYAASNPQFSFNPGDLTKDPGYQFQLQQGQNAITNTAASQGLNQSGAALKELTQYGQGLAGTYYNDAFNRAKQTFDTNQSATLQNLGTLINAGQTATGQSQQAQQNAGNQIASNTLGAGYYAGNTGNQAAQYNAGLNTQGQEFNANLGVSGEEAAGQFLMQGAQGKAAGQAGMWNGIGGAFSGAANSLVPGASKFAGIF